MLFLKLPFAVRPGLTGSRVSKDAKQFRLNLWVPGWLDGLNSQVYWGLEWPGLLNGQCFLGGLFPAIPATDSPKF